MEVSQQSNVEHTNALQNRSVNTGKKMPLTLQIALCSIMTALTTVSTMILAIPIPLTEGMFNFGELMVFISAILFGPIIGGFAGGVGSAMADVFLNYAYYAPYTFIAKGLEGLIVGLIYQFLKKQQFSDKLIKIIIAIFSIITSLLIGYIGSSLFSHLLSTTFWYIIGAGIGLTIIVLSLFLNKMIGAKIIAIIPGGLVMIATYFTVQYFTYGIAGALFELPFNFLQVIAGMIIAISLTPFIEPFIPGN
ncbi:hypothetical protein NEF87_004509 [Candidatus Lokiarchaeum ossiferum]|uniref:ECF transporter S component n=1 Tax=Candidatus Lokiarchaeum ossiferum TaxID=2951803 RepID=A0ABY6I0J3_9ARCH|nr:hypothetical protein NEF87_004509 [Candidatus Lokiarchaeum sp. B-35]